MSYDARLVWARVFRPGVAGDVDESVAERPTYPSLVGEGEAICPFRWCQ
jgi:hypothetical protein